MKQESKYAGVWQLLKRNISKGQLLGYSLANVVGLTVVLVGLMFYLDSNHNADNQEQYFRNDYSVISKKVEGINADPVSFSSQEVAELQQQPWVKRIGRFTSSRFAVYGSVTLGGHSLGSYMFFESIPDDFFDIKPEGWDFDPDRHFIPVIINKDYLTLYNFGFAVPQGLPQLSERMISSVPIEIRLLGDNNRVETFDARVVGFSQRLNTIAVPQQFMDWANERFYTPAPDEPEPEPARLIMEVDRMQSDAMSAYFAAHDIEEAGDKANEGKISQFLGVVSSVVTVNGLVICALALFILMLSIFLLLQQSREKLHNLMLLGYSPSQVGRYYVRVMLWVNVVITIVAVIATFLARRLWVGSLTDLGIGGASFGIIVLTAAAYLLFVSLINVRVIHTRLHRIWRS